MEHSFAELSFESASDPALAVEAGSGRILAVNGPGRRLFAADGNLDGARVVELFPGQVPALTVFTEAVLHKGSYVTRALAPRRADGLAGAFECLGTVIEGAPVPSILLSFSDLDARRQRDLDADAEDHMRGGIAEWRRTERLFQDIERGNQLILRAAGEGIFGVNDEGRTTFVNPAAEAMLGWEPGALVGRDMHACVHHHRADGSHYPHQECPIYAAFRDGSVHHVENEMFFRRDGSGFWVEYTSTPIRDRGRLVGAVIIFRDVTARHEADERLRAALAEVDSLRERLQNENAYLQEEIRSERSHRGIIGSSAAIQAILRQVELVARTDAAVLITGESGTGKELIASAIHEASERGARPLIRVNCAAVPRDLFESEFFGHVKGAFTGALRDRLGRFELADGGTLFLDEVGEIPLELQGKLLRVLQEGELQRIGEERTRHVDVRVVAATNRDLRREVREGRFREDLFFRLAVFPIVSVPLRDRLDDVPALALHFLAMAERRLRTSGLKLSKSDVMRLCAYDWPGNVRELQNVIERAAILARDGRLAIDLPGAPQLPPKDESHLIPTGVLLTETDRRERDRAALAAALEAARGRVSGPGGAAELLGLRPTTLASRLKKLAIDPRSFK
ncbi:MAG TPA: sigma 54-interacting transcriptional regulator [Bosea sp. (in: a-proteobacteria)]|jgi:PAS domain S-box-containing protein|uniref:sigma 54-interacting transcriptional regulator n=1 Tax=Bosea sp. (in: a-proteobacteria) TaxID=1871050 RepID=UPI002E0D8EF6|nr:sigma 54-interacting transcriptional regulator [Bosea sp. (in: a-proteobacteria)]